MEEQGQQVANEQTQVVNQVDVVGEKKPLLRQVYSSSNSKDVLMVLLAFLVIGAGVLTGWLLSGASKGKNQTPVSLGGAVRNKKEAGISDEKVFKDTAQGVLRQGGVNGEGTHHLEREGGPSQYVYLTSSVIDLDSFVDKNVQVWGETIKAAKAGWLMDVGKVKILD